MNVISLYELFYFQCHQYDKILQRKHFKIFSMPNPPCLGNVTLHQATIAPKALSPLPFQRNALHFNNTSRKQ